MKGVNKSLEDRFAGCTPLGNAAIFTKLPPPEYPRMPQLESLSMTLTRRVLLKSSAKEAGFLYTPQSREHLYNSLADVIGAEPA